MCKYPSREYFVKEYLENNKTREQLAKENNVSVSTIKTHLYEKRIVKPSILPCDLLYEMYVVQKKTMKEIAAATGHDRNAVARAIKANHIDVENHYIQYDDTLDDEWISLYLNSGLSTAEIANRYSVSHGTVKRHLVHCGIDMRSYSDAQRLAKGKGEYSKDLSDRNTMYDLYITQNMSLKDIGERYDCAPHVIRRILVNMGIQIRDQSEVKIGLLTGKDHPNWKGGITSLSKRLREFYAINLAPQCRKRDGYKCLICGSKNDLHVHHVVPFSWIVNHQIQQHPDLDPIRDSDALYDLITHNAEFLDIGNLRTVCAKCHLFKIHGYKKTISSQASDKDEGSTTISKESTL